MEILVSFMQEVSSLYIHFPLCMHLCNYCDFYKKKLETDQQISDFEKLFLAQWDAHDQFLEDNKRIINGLETLYIGGGTPSLWKSRGAEFMNKLLRDKKINFTENYEYTIEVDPGTCSFEDLDIWRNLGVNRFSVGVQAYTEELLKLMDRKHSIQEVNELLTYLSTNSLNFSVDLMIGLPSEQKRDLVFEINSLIDLGAKHFSVYILKTRKNYLHAASMPDDEIVRSEYLLVCETLKKHGFLHYEVSNFARAGFESKHNQKYWNYVDVAALGPNASGLLVREESACRYQWKSQSAGFQKELIEGESLIIEKLFLGLRSSQGINLFDLFKMSEQREILLSLMEEWELHGYLVKHNSQGEVVLSSLGFLMCDSVIDDIFKKIDFN